VSVVPAAGEAEVGGSLEPRSSRPDPIWKKDTKNNNHNINLQE
jgi:hypothetical protein